MPTMPAGWCGRCCPEAPNCFPLGNMTSFPATEFRKETMFRLSPMPSLPGRPRPHAFPSEDDCQRFADFHPLYEGMLEPWPAPGAIPLWRQPRPGPPLVGPPPGSAKPMPPSMAPPLGPPLSQTPLPLINAMPFFPADDPCIYSDSWRESPLTGLPVGWRELRELREPPCWREVREVRDTDPLSSSGSAVATPNGIMSLRLHDRVRVDMSVDRAVRVINLKNNIVLALGGNGASAALLHPNGRTYQYGSRVEILAHDARGNNKFAKMWYKGVSFTSEQCALVYLVDTAGTRTTTDNFSDMSQDISLSVFYNDSRHGPSYVAEAVNLLESGQYWVTDEGIENWLINGIRVSQTPDGLVRVARNSNKYQVRTSPSNGTASLTTPFLHCTASLGQTSHLFVRRGERRMHYDGTSFIVRNAGHSAGFDEKNQLKVY